MANGQTGLGVSMKKQHRVPGIRWAQRDSGLQKEGGRGRNRFQVGKHRSTVMGTGRHRRGLRGESHLVQGYRALGWSGGPRCHALRPRISLLFRAQSLPNAFFYFYFCQVPGIKPRNSSWGTGGHPLSYTHSMSDYLKSLEQNMKGPRMPRRGQR